MITTLKKQFFELGERPLKFYTVSQNVTYSHTIWRQSRASALLQANCKHIKAVEKFSGNCEPVFVFYQVNSQPVGQLCFAHSLMQTDLVCVSQDGKVLNTVTGVNAPVISTSVDKLSAEAAAVAAAKA